MSAKQRQSGKVSIWNFQFTPVSSEADFIGQAEDLADMLNELSDVFANAGVTQPTYSSACTLIEPARAMADALAMNAAKYHFIAKTIGGAA
jgi:hypothetical protein